MRFFIFIALIGAFGIAGAEDVPPYVREAEVRYKQGDYEGAIGYLLAVPGVAQLSPKLTPMSRDSRARLFYDLGCCYLAAGDSLRADWAFREAFALNNRLDRGYFENADPGTFWWALLHGEEAARRMKTKRLFAVMRSLFGSWMGSVLPGVQEKGICVSRCSGWYVCRAGGAVSEFSECPRSLQSDESISTYKPAIYK